MTFKFIFYFSVKTIAFQNVNRVSKRKENITLQKQLGGEWVISPHDRRIQLSSGNDDVENNLTNTFYKSIFAECLNYKFCIYRCG